MDLAEAPFQTLSAAVDWYTDWFARAALPFWSTVGFDQERNSFHERVGGRGGDEVAQRRARVQARQIWVYATASRLGLGEKHLRLAQSAYTSFVRKYRHSDGLFITSTYADGSPLDATPRLYEQAFALNAMAALHIADPEMSEPLEDAQRLRTALEPFRHTRGGFREAGPHPFQANAIMHLLEAALAWEETGQRDWLSLSDEIVELAGTHFIDGQGGFLREFFDAAWSPASGLDGRRLEPGHQFEWAWLLDRWGSARGSIWARDASAALFKIGEAGVDQTRKVAVNGLWDDLTVSDATARLWPQTEYLKASLALGHIESSIFAAQGLWRYLNAPVPGAWLDLQQTDGTFVLEPSPASSFYHIAGPCFAMAGMHKSRPNFDR